MKLTKTKLKQIIREEFGKILEDMKDPKVLEKVAAFKDSIGKKVTGSGYPGATIAGPPAPDPDGKIWLVPLNTDGTEPDWIPINNLEIIGL